MYNNSFNEWKFSNLIEKPALFAQRKNSDANLNYERVDVSIISRCRFADTETTIFDTQLQPLTKVIEMKHGGRQAK